VTDFLDDKVREMRDRLREIEPLVLEHQRLRTALDALDSSTKGTTAKGSSVRNAVAGATRSTASSRRGRRPAGEPTRADRLLELASQQPGITVAQAAQVMGVAPNGLYQVVAKLSQEGRLRKDGAGLFATGKQPPSQPESETSVAQEGATGPDAGEEQTSDSPQDDPTAQQPEAESAGSDPAVTGLETPESPSPQQPPNGGAAARDEHAEGQSDGDTRQDSPTRIRPARSGQARAGGKSRRSTTKRAKRQRSSEQ